MTILLVLLLTVVTVSSVPTSKARPHPKPKTNSTAILEDRVVWFAAPLLGAIISGAIVITIGQINSFAADISNGQCKIIFQTHGQEDGASFDMNFRSTNQDNYNSELIGAGTSQDSTKERVDGGNLEWIEIKFNGRKGKGKCLSAIAISCGENTMRTRVKEFVSISAEDLVAGWFLTGNKHMLTRDFENRCVMVGKCDTCMKSLDIGYRAFSECKDVDNVCQRKHCYTHSQKD